MGKWLYFEIDCYNHFYNHINIIIFVLLAYNVINSHLQIIQKNKQHILGMYKL